MRLSEQRTEVLKTIRGRSSFAPVFYATLFLASLAVTPIAKRHPAILISIGAWTAAAAIVHGFGVFRQKNIWFISGRLGMAAGLGALGFLSVFGFELGWTTFFVLLTTLCAASLEVPVLAPRLSLAIGAISLIVGPPMIASYVAISGMKGRALSVFFTLFFIALANQARIRRNEFIAALKTAASLRKVVDVIPG